jgi:hypothetical protein
VSIHDETLIYGIRIRGRDCLDRYHGREIQDSGFGYGNRQEVFGREGIEKDHMPR